MFLLAGFDREVSVLQFIVLGRCSLLSLPQGAADGTDALLVVVEFSQAQLQVVLVKAVHQRLVPLGLEKREVDGTS